MKIQKQSIAELINDPANVRKHSEKNLEAIKGSLARFGQQKPIVVGSDGVVVAGNGTLEAARQLGWQEVAIVKTKLEGSDRTAYAIADNRTGELAEWDDAALAEQLSALAIDDEELLEAAGFDEAELEKLVSETTGLGADDVVEDEAPKPPADPVTKPGDLWQLGEHRVLCGDSTKAEDVARLMGGEKSMMLHADPPYGMGKESDGVENDNLYNEKLDAFQMAWWSAWRPSLKDNASAYIWGNPEPLWRLWFSKLRGSEEISLRNEIVWDKGGGQGQCSAGQRSYSVSTERCLFFMLGRQFFGNVNKDDFFEGYQPILDWLIGEVKKMQWTPADVKRITGVGMFGHWFSKSQWQLIPENRYLQLQKAAEGRAFVLSHRELKNQRQEQLGGDKAQSFNELRAHFDNTHDNMNEVWRFPRVHGEERHGHATPKPVAVAGRCIKSSAEAGALVLEPFLGSGTTLIAAEQLGRRCYGIEISPAYCDVIVERWENLTGNKAKRVSHAKAS